MVASGKIRVEVMVKLYQRVLYGKETPAEWKTRVVVPIYEGKGDVVNCRLYRGIKLLEHAMKVVERVLEKRLRGIVNLDELHFEFMPEKKQLMLFLC